MSEPADDEPRHAFDESRRLTGPNRYFADTAVVLTPLGPAADQPRAQQAWAQHVRAVCGALGWADPQPFVHRHAQGCFLAFAAPEALLFTATEINEWAWERAAGAEQDLRAQGFDALYAALADDPRAALEFGHRAQQEFARPLARLKAAARERALPYFDDDDTLSIGAGTGSLTWPRAALPLPMDVPWARLHDVPTVVITGSNGKTTTARALAAMARTAGQVAGVCNTEGVTVGTETVASGDYAGPAGSRAVLRHPAVQWAVLETARGGLLRRGLAVRRADVALVTNVSEDHLGEYGIAGLEDIAEVKLIVARTVVPTPAQAGGTLVLNGADAVLMRMAQTLPHAAAAKQALFALDFGHPALAAHRATGGTTCGVRAGRLLLAHAGAEHDLGAVAEMPITVQGAATHNIENLAAAALTAVAAGLPLEAVRHTLQQFGRQPSDNPGRLEQHRHRGATVLIDYAHNPDGLAQLLRVARALKPQRLGLLLGQAGNRDDGAIAELARTAAGFAPERVVIKELPKMLRGRPLGQVPALIEQALLGTGFARGRLSHEPDEAAAARALLAWAAPGDVIVLPVHTRSVRQALGAELAAQLATPAA